MLVDGFKFIDTANWVGTEYTPARAANSLWWASFEDFEQDVDRELRLASTVLGITTLRVFLHTLAWQHLGSQKHSEYLSQFLKIAASHNLKVGIVLFGDGWYCITV